jgi:hypothetical protein
VLALEDAMNALALRLVIGWILVISSIALVPGSAPAARQSSCDPAYPDICLPPVEEAGDLNCTDIDAVNITVLDPDPHQLDTDLDGIGCEASGSSGSTAPAPTSEPAPEPIAADCDLSYPDFCLPPPPPDLSCADIGEPLTVIHRPLLGATDPHYLDPDGNGIGCEYLAP